MLVRRVTMISAAAAWFLACTSADEDEETSVSGASAPSTLTADDGMADSGGSMESSGGGSSSGGEQGCAEGAEPAEFSEVEGCGEVLGVSYCSEGAGHVDIGTDIEWMNNPPHSGPHFPMWASWGEHERPLERGYWVHNMEHGGIVLGYLCPGGCDEDLEVLRQVIEERPDSRIIVTQDPLLEEPGFYAASWTWVHHFDTAELDEVLCFVDQHFNHAPEDVP